MRSLNYYFPSMGRNEVVHIYPLGDIHWGSSGCDKDKLHEFVDMVKSKPTAYVVLMGDLLESASSALMTFLIVVKTVSD
jgi:hypothetical protein